MVIVITLRFVAASTVCLCVRLFVKVSVTVMTVMMLWSVLMICR